jgi:hypothetical protein
MLEDVDEFEKWLSDTIKAGQDKLDVTNSTIAYILLQKGLAYYLKSICSKK